MVHCRNQAGAQAVVEAIRDRLEQCHLELTPTKIRIVHCNPEWALDSVGGYDGLHRSTKRDLFRELKPMPGAPVGASSALGSGHSHSDHHRPTLHQVLSRTKHSGKRSSGLSTMASRIGSSAL